MNSTKARYTTTNTVRDSELDLAMFGKIVLNALFSGESNKFRVCFYTEKNLDRFEILRFEKSSIEIFKFPAVI